MALKNEEESTVRNSETTLRAALIAASLAGILFVGELVFRLGIAAKISFFRVPDQYADELSDDDYWKLHQLWVREGGSTGTGAVDPLLGWAPRKTPRNPLGVITESAAYVPDFAGRVILCFGDSFMAGAQQLPIADRLPQQLAAVLPQYEVYNFGVGGYGVDQILLRFRTVHPQFAQAVVVIGILTRDLDRSVLTYRGAPKPYFVLEDDRLVLREPAADPSRFLLEHPPSIHSYFLSFLSTRTWRLVETVYGDHIKRRSAKIAINARIIEEMVGEARAHRLEPIFVIFYVNQELHVTSWRERLIKDALSNVSARYVDSKKLFLEASGSERKSTRRFYLLPGNGHPNGAGYQLLATELAKVIVESETRRNSEVGNQAGLGARLPEPILDATSDGAVHSPRGG